MLKEYALYKGDEFLGVGTVNELAHEFNVKPNTIRFYLSPTYAKRGGKKGCGRRVLVDLESEGDV